MNPADTLIPSADLNTAAPETLNLLRTRRSGSAKAMIGPGPNASQLAVILSAASRVPDHGKLTPWRFILFEGEARESFGQRLATLFREQHPSAIEEIIEFEAKRFLRAPVVVGVVSAALGNAKVPEWEQVLSAGAVCMNLLLATHALGFTGSWITEWYAYDERVRPLLKLKPHERMAGFLYLGTPAAPLEDRPRPPLETIVEHWSA